ncbi:DNA/RNA-binding protein KIN17 [Thelohanellus kitauei]|uniref:DNA/RNA-binding protein KIN17 n=1 Tax=Thelohanellus kitauei TaxID=669202 RepID=A0A0C2N692_THEKT|nr:DNA/RNA-binding protein KIN17 [Thelohanellus kitauei]
MPRQDPNLYLKRSLSSKKRPKSLKKLKWYCQMCEKQCSDELGFRRHCATESHKHQMALFAENPDHFINQFSAEFEHDFMDLLKRKYASNFVLANHIYQDFVKDRDHIHMNSTKWNTLNDFLDYLSDKNKIRVEETEKGINIAYVDPEHRISKRKNVPKTHKSALEPKNEPLKCFPQYIPETEEATHTPEKPLQEYKSDSKISFKLKKSIPR